MGPLDLADHLLSFAAPAVFTGVLVALLARLFWQPARAGRWWRAPLANSLAGLAALAGGLAYFGHDGKMASYGLLLFAVASSQWLLSRAWRG